MVAMELTLKALQSFLMEKYTLYDINVTEELSGDEYGGTYAEYTLTVELNWDIVVRIVGESSSGEPKRIVGTVEVPEKQTQWNHVKYMVGYMEIAAEITKLAAEWLEEHRYLTSRCPESGAKWWDATEFVF